MSLEKYVVFKCLITTQYHFGMMNKWDLCINSLSGINLLISRRAEVTAARSLTARSCQGQYARMDMANFKSQLCPSLIV